MLAAWIDPRCPTFRGETKNGFGSHGEPVVFALAADGRVTRLKIGESS